MSATCPRCKTALITDNINRLNPEFSFDGIEVDQCESCNGIWFDKGELDGIKDVIEPVFMEIRKIPSQEEQMVPLRCPKCDNTEMEKIQSDRDKKVIMDECPNCEGVWLDGGELKAIQEENAAKVLWDLMRWMSK